MPVAVGETELAVAVHRRRAHQITDVVQPRRVGLTAGGEFADNMVEQPAAAVDAREDQVAVTIAAGFLLGRIGRQSDDIFPVWHAVEQGEGRVPRLGNHPVGTLRGVEIVGEADQAIGNVRIPSAV